MVYINEMFTESCQFVIEPVPFLSMYLQVIRLASSSTILLVSIILLEEVKGPPEVWKRTAHFILLKIQ